MRTKEANHLKDKMDSLSFNSSKVNLVESTVPTNKDRFKDEGQKNQKTSYPKRKNKFSIKIEKPKELCYVWGKPGHKVYQCPLRKGQSRT